MKRTESDISNREEAEWSDGELDDGGLGQRSEEPLQKPKGDGSKL